ncbi:MAG: bacterio-opsin activator domain-containing protein, partial [Halanaeroarchaeum sp.]
MVDGSPAIRSEADYRRVLDATRTYREELVITVAGAVGLTPGEMASISLADFRPVSEGGTGRLLAVGDGTDGRLVPVPGRVWSAIEKYANERNRDTDESLISVSDRRIQMLIGEIGDRVADLTVTSRTLRRWHARRLLDDGVHPRVVRSVVAYDSLDTVIDRLDPPSERDVVAAMGAISGEAADGTRGIETPGADGAERALDASVAVGRALEGASTRSEIESGTCDALVTAGYAGAWIRGPSTDGEGPVRTGAGVRTDQVPSVLTETSLATGDQASGTTSADPLPPRESVGDARITLPLDTGHSLAAWGIVVPLHGAGTTHGTLTVATTAGTVADRERSVLTDVGRRVGRAMTAASTRRLLHADSVVELEFGIEDRADLLVDVASACGCSLALSGLVPLADRGVVAYVAIEGTAAESVVERATTNDDVERARLVRAGGSDAVVELAMSGSSILVTLAGLGGTVTAYTVDEGRGTVTVDVSPDADVRGVAEAVETAFPESTLA